jgi:DNA-directed RNA polymerase specialized sigma24 family protein
MSKSNRNSAALVYFTTTSEASAVHASVVLDAVIRAHRDQLVQIARQLLGNCRQDADDIVQDVCLEVLEGDTDIGVDPAQALEDLRAAVVARAIAHREGND